MVDGFTVIWAVAYGVHYHFIGNRSQEGRLAAEMQAAVDAARAQIIAGDIMVHNFTEDGSCPVQMQ